MAALNARRRVTHLKKTSISYSSILKKNTYLILFLPPENVPFRTSKVTLSRCWFGSHKIRKGLIVPSDFVSPKVTLEQYWVFSTCSVLKCPTITSCFHMSFSSVLFFFPHPPWWACWASSHWFVTLRYNFYGCFRSYGWCATTKDSLVQQIFWWYTIGWTWISLRFSSKVIVITSLHASNKFRRTNATNILWKSRSISITEM